MEERIASHDFSAEEAVIGSILVEGDCIRQVSDWLDPADFYHEVTGWCYEACLSLLSEEEHIDQITLANELKNKGRLEAIGGVAYLSHLISITPSSMDIETHAMLVKKLSGARKIQAGMTKISNQVGAGTDFGEVLEDASRIIDDLKHSGAMAKSTLIEPIKASDAIMEVLTQDSATREVMSYGFIDLDKVTTGIYPEEYIIIGARTSVGKTQLMAQVARHLSMDLGKTGLYVSLEMGIHGMMEREIAMATGINIKDIRRHQIPEEKWGEISDLAGVISTRPLYFLTLDKTSVEVSMIARQMKNQIALDFLMVDYIQLLKDCRGATRNVSTHNLISSASRLFKTLAGDLGIPVIVASQIGRQVEQRPAGAQSPRLSDLKESGSLEEDADVVLLLYRNTHDQTKPPDPVLEIKMAKNRQLGPGTVVKLQWLESNHCYVDKVREE